MIVFPGMLASAAEQAGIEVPSNHIIDDVDSYQQTHPRFFIFCMVQLARSMRPGEHWENAKVIAAIPEDQLKTITLAQLIEMGLQYP